MSIIGDALQRAEREGAPLNAPQPVASSPRPVLEMPSAPRPDTVAAPRRKAHSIARRARRRVPAATLMLFVLAVLTVYMLADPRWSGSNWGLDQFWPPVLPMDEPAPLVAESERPPTQTASTLAGHSIDPPTSPPSTADDTPRAAAPVATTDSPGAESDVAAANTNQPITQGAEVEPTSRYVLSGVMLGGSTRLAVINGAIVEIGQVIDGAKVVAISRRDVTLAIGGKKVRIAIQAPGSGRKE